jgi:hypothetical protein
MNGRQILAVAAAAATGFSIWSVGTGALRSTLGPSGGSTLAGSLEMAASWQSAAAWLLIVVLLRGMFWLNRVATLRDAAHAASPLAIIGMAVTVGYHMTRTGVSYALAAAVLTVGLIYGVTAILYLMAVGRHPGRGFRASGRPSRGSLGG